MNAPSRRLARAVVARVLLGLVVLAFAALGPHASSPGFGDSRAAAERQVDLLMALHRHRPQRGWGLRALAVTERLRAVGVLRGAGGPVAVEPADADALRRLGRSDAAWLFTWVGSRHAYAWWLDGNGLRAREVAEPAATLRLARRLHANLSRGVSELLAGQIDADAASLGGAWLPPPSRRPLPRTLVVVAEGPLADVPWALLPWPGHAGARVIDRMDVARLASVGELSALRRRIVARGGPTPGGGWRSWGTGCTPAPIRASPLDREPSWTSLVCVG